MAQLSSPINSVSMAVHLSVLLLAGLWSLLRNLGRLHPRQYGAVAGVTAGVLLLTAAGIAGWSQFRPQTAAELASVSYQRSAENHLATSTADVADVSVSGWLTSFNEKQSVDSFAKHANQMNEVLPFWYRLTADGTIVMVNGVTKQAEVMAIAARHDVKVIPTVNNEFDARRVSDMLSDEQLRQQAIDRLVALADNNNYAGWDIDWEQLDAKDKIGYAYFIEDLASALHQHGRTLSVSVPVPTTVLGKSHQADSMDYARIAKVADTVRLMAYDYHEGTSTPGPVTPLDQYEAALQTIVKQVPADKLIIGLPTYGYDWNKTRGVGAQYDEVTGILKETKGKFKRDMASQALTANYRDKQGSHTIWYEDATSMRAKMTIAKAYDINQFTLWRLGGEDPALWNGIRSQGN